MNVIDVSNLSKTYKNGVTALDNFNISVKESEIFTLLGENGAGKSTLIKILTTFIKKDAGKVKILGYDLDYEYKDIRKNIAAVYQQASIDTHLTLKENMIFQSHLYNIPKKDAINIMYSLIDSFGLNEYIDLPVNSYSGGVRRRLDIAMNMMSNPKILFLDEPTVGMDIKSRKSMWAMIKRIKDQYQTTIFLTTHYLEEADNLSDRIMIMKDGKDIITDTPSNLKKVLKSKFVEVSFFNEEYAKENFELIQKTYKNISIKNKTILIGGNFNHVNKFLIENDINFSGIKIYTPSIEDIFLNYTKEYKEDLNGNNIYAL
ncbi:MAG TPA: ABC transporter ATP-binding protein [Tissierellaceae bacterium]